MNPSYTGGTPRREETEQLSSILETIERLRTPVVGCPWDLEQTHGSLQGALLEESYEVMEALESEDVPAMIEELGDLLTQVIFHAQIGRDNGTFTIYDVARHANEKLVRRHPHVFGQETAGSSEVVKQRWDQIKAQERKGKGRGDSSLLDGVPVTMPALSYAQAMQERTGRRGLMDVGNHRDERDGEIEVQREPVTYEQRRIRIGEMLFQLVATARTWGVDAEGALRSANREFYQRMRKNETSN